MNESPIQALVSCANQEITDPNNYVNSEQVRAILLGLAFQFTGMFVLEECDPEYMKIPLATLINWLELTARTPSEFFE